MKTRRRSLPAGWYPDSERNVRKQIEGYLAKADVRQHQAQAAVVPHAGWEFSGAIAAEAFATLRMDADVVVVVGGHLGPNDGILAASEEGYETPLGVLSADLRLLDEMRHRLRIADDRHADNTTEVQFPFVKYFFPSARALALRASPSDDAVQLGRVLSEASDRLGRTVVVVGSTDLTHYGSNYGYVPHGSGPHALQWVTEVNDRRFIESLLAGSFRQALQRSHQERSACSAGGAVAAGSYGAARSLAPGLVLRYMTSHDVYPSESFVGYVGIVWPTITNPAHDRSSEGTKP